MRSDFLVRAGAVVFAIGAVAVVAILVPFFLGHGHDAPTALSLVALLLPVGLGMALLGLLREVRSSSLSGTPSPPPSKSP